MKSTKISTINSIPSGVNQKLVPAKKYNELWDDVKTIENSKSAPASDSFVRDLGSGDVLVFSVINGLSTNVRLIGGMAPADRKSFVSAGDFLSKVSYGGSDPITYAIRRVGFSTLTYYSNPDDAILTLLDSDIGRVVLIEIHVKHGSIDNFNVTYVEVQNNLLL